MYDAGGMGVKVSVVGGGSTYTPELVEGFVARTDRVPVDELILLDIDQERLDVVGGLARRILARAGWAGQLVCTTDRDRAVDGADFVVVQLRVGGQAARLLDETIPPRFGCIGQETTGPGGFAKALRTVPVVLELAEEVARRGAPGAWIVDFTNPTGIVTQALLDDGHRAVGLCNVGIGMQRQLASMLGVAPERIELDHAGLNHLTWVRGVRVDGSDVLPGLLERRADELADAVDLPVAVLRELGAVPSSYLRYYYLTREVLAYQLDHPSRAEEVQEIEAELLELYRDPTLDHKPELLERRGGAWYSEAAAQLIASLHDGAGDLQIVNVRNEGTFTGLADDDVVEVPARVGPGGPVPVPAAPLAPEMLGLVQHAKAYEHLAVRAAVSGDRHVALLALLANPLVGDYRVAESLLGSLLDANRHHLPRFAA